MVRELKAAEEALSAATSRGAMPAAVDLDR
jgi:hypothetical protein